MNPPFVVEVTRGPVLESVHEVVAVVTDSTGRVVESFGDPDWLTPPRSAIKSLQAIPLVDSGAADAFDFDDADLSLSVASHSGEPAHIDRVASILTRLDLAPADLECGPSLPLNEAAACSYLAGGGEATSILHNCSGKHIGFLTLARHLGVDTRGYLEPDHPVQQEVLGAVSSLCAVPVANLGVDGCGAPVLPMPLRNMARGFATMVDPTVAHADPAARILKAIAAEPWFMAGTDRLDTRVCEVLGSGGYIKGGAEAVVGGALVGPRLGLALKAVDGSRRAVEVAVINLLVQMGAIDPDGNLADLVTPVIHNAAGKAVGEIRVARQF